MGTARVRIALADRAAPTAGEIPFATGRAPRTTDVGRETVALTPGDWLTAADACRVTAVADGRFYAVGHVDGRAWMTHLGAGRPAGAQQYAEDCRGRARMPVDAANAGRRRAVAGAVRAEPARTG
ncbi:hypothetical protein [Streptomyces sp. NPDC046870]|uniref:hypothetical protein n=1 Tax=Streptomyces sp. NPDC046870 TaxID=3155135 RepID=UPI00345478AD